MPRCTVNHNHKKTREWWPPADVQRRASGRRRGTHVSAWSAVKAHTRLRSLVAPRTRPPRACTVARRAERIAPLGPVGTLLLQADEATRASHEGAVAREPNVCLVPVAIVTHAEHVLTQALGARKEAPRARQRRLKAPATGGREC